MPNTQFPRVLTLLISFISILTTPLSGRADEPGLLLYCGITMVRPMTELARQFEQVEKIKITISQGGSEDLYQSAKKSRLGDLYLPGEPSYRAKHLAEGLLGEYKVVGYNQMALIVAKGNPKKVQADLRELLRKDLITLLGNAVSGSVGNESKAMLDAAGLYPKVVSKAAILMPDSRGLNLAMKRGEGDITLNWRATAFFPDNIEHIDVVDLPAKIAPPQALLLNQLTFSRNPVMARKFIDFIASPSGQAVFRKYGFLDNTKTY